MDLKGRHFLKLTDYTPEEIHYLIDLAADLKTKKKTLLKLRRACLLKTNPNDL